MAYTEIKTRGKTKYYYRVKSIRIREKVGKERIYLGKGLTREQLKKQEAEADKELLFLNNILTEKEVQFLEGKKREYLRQPSGNKENRYEAFCALFTYDSNAIEGNTLTLQETAGLLFDKRVPANTSLREINEALNHKEALDYLLGYKEDVTKVFICRLHKMIIQKTLKKELEGQQGKYRTLQVYLRGAELVPPKPSQVPKEMKSLLAWYTKNRKKLHPLVLAAYFHVGFEAIHPFIDGNGRVGRLLLNFIMHKNNYPMVNIPASRKITYYKALHEAQVNGNLRPFLDLLLALLKESKLTF